MLVGRSFCILLACLTLTPIEIESSSVYRPTLCPWVAWQTNALTLISNSTLGSLPQGFFVEPNETIYVVDSANDRVLIYTQNPLALTQNITGGLRAPAGIFVTMNGDIFIDNGYAHGRVEKYSLSNTTVGVPVMRINDSCSSLFVDVNDVLYCSLTNLHQIRKISLNSSDFNQTAMAAGTGICAPASDTLCFPRGIFVDSNLDLYVADTANDRIQLFPFAELNGTTILGNGSSSSAIVLRGPTSVFIDGSQHIYIVDSGNRRILRSTSTGYRCIIGCTPSTTVSAIALAFDSRGNIFTLDEQNRRIHQFLLTRNACSRCLSLSLSSFYLLESSIVSYHRPQLCHNATWNSTAITYLNQTILGTSPRGIFIDLDNIFYWASSGSSRLFLWFQRNSTGNRTMAVTGPQSLYASPFMSIDQEVYFVLNSPAGLISKRSINNVVMNTTIQFSSVCYGLFIDTNNTLYCSLYAENRVARVSLKSSPNGASESSINQTIGPWGLFVDTNFDVYVCEASAARVRRYSSGRTNGTIVAGQGVPSGLRFSFVTDVILDANGHLYLADNGNHRIVRVWSTGYQCLAGCSCRNGSGDDQLTKPISLRFDSYGNLYVADEFNRRMQKFLLLSACGEISTTAGSNTCSSNVVTIFPTTAAETTSADQVQSSTPSSISPNPGLRLLACANSSRLGSFCNESTAPCDILQPCLHSGTCLNNNTNQQKYQCLCTHHFTGDHCQTSVALENRTSIDHFEEKPIPDSSVFVV